MRRTIWLWLILILGGCATTAVTPTSSPTPIPTETPLPTPEPFSVAGFDAFLTTAAAARAEDRNWLVSNYLAGEPETPLIDGTTAVFIYQGSGNAVTLNGDMNNWGNDGSIALERLPGTDLWWYRGEFEAAARLDYRFNIDGDDRLDPRNPNTLDTDLVWGSVLQMPAYDTPWQWDGTAATGSLTPHAIASDYLGQTRTMFVYEPATTLIGQPLPSLYVHDGGDYLSMAAMQAQLDALIAAREIPPLLVVFIPPVEREEIEYNTSPSYRSFVSEELVSWVQDSYDVDESAERTGTMGAGLGGLVAMRLGIEYPDVFGLIGTQSAAFSLSETSLLDMLANQPQLPIRPHLVVGTYETNLPRLPDGDFLTANRRMVDILAQKGYDYSYAEYPEGHSWGLWSAHIADMLIYLYQWNESPGNESPANE